MGIAISVDGSIYIADLLNSRVRKVAPDGAISTVAGTGVAGYSGDGDSATSAQVRNPAGVAIGIDGSVYIADISSNAVRRILPDGTITTIPSESNGPSGV